MRVATAQDRAFVEAVINHPMLRVWKSYEGAPDHCDAARFMQPPSFTLVCDDGCFPIEAMGPGRYAVHADLLPSCRGQRAVDRSREAMRFVFDNTDALELLALVPETNPRARWMARQLGFEAISVISRVWPVAGRLYDVHVLGAKRPH